MHKLKSRSLFLTLWCILHPIIAFFAKKYLFLSEIAAKSTSDSDDNDLVIDDGTSDASIPQVDGSSDKKTKRTRKTKQSSKKNISEEGTQLSKSKEADTNTNTIKVIYLFCSSSVNWI